MTWKETKEVTKEKFKIYNIFLWICAFPGLYNKFGFYTSLSFIFLTSAIIFSIHDLLKYELSRRIK